MSDNKRIVWLIVIMMTAVSLSTAVAIRVLYKTAFELERKHLIQNVDDQAHLMEAVARFDRLHQDDPGSSEAATLSQIENAYDHYPSYGQLAEIAVARREGDRIVYQVTHGRVDPQPVVSIPFSSPLGEPMRLALSGHSGDMIGLDYRGTKVLAAYAPVPVLNAGVVAKIDLAAIRAPFLRAAALVIGLALVLVTVGAVLFVRLTNPIVKHLTETEQRYQRIFSGAPVPIWEEDFSGVIDALQGLRDSGVTDLRRHLVEHPGALRHLVGGIRIKEANAAALRLFGARSVRQFIAWFEGIFVPTTLELSADMLQALWDGREVLLNPTVTVRTQAGRDLTIQLSMVTPSSNDGYRSVPVSALDVTADVNLRRREEELDLIMSSTGEGIFGLDPGGRCTFANRAALEMLGYRDASDVLGRDMHALIHHTCRNGAPLPAERCPIHRACRDDIVVRLDDELLWRADGASFPAEYRSYPMLRDGTVVGTVVTFTNIAERKEKEAQLLQVQKMETVGRLTGGIAHDFNNLLAIILSNLRFLADRLAGTVDAELSEPLDDATSAAEDGATLTRRLLAFSRRQPLEPSLMDLDVFIEHTGRFLRRVTGEGIELIARGGGGPLPVYVDRQQLENALINLAINARDAMPNGGTLTIEARRQDVVAAEAAQHVGPLSGTYVVVSVADTGEGMDPEAVKRAVEPFYSTKPMGKGSGLGLSMALGFAQQSGGDLGISSAPGRGTTVSMYLPEATPEHYDRGVAAERPMCADDPIETATILVAEDDERTRRFAARTLSALGYRVLEAEDVAAAARILEQDVGVDLLFTDVVMPGEGNGLELGYWARQHCPGMPVLLTSGFAQQDHGEAAPSGEPLPFLKKPYSKEGLEEAVRSLLRTEDG